MFTCSQANTSVSVSYLDLPDLSSLTQAYPELAPLVADPILNHDRLWVVGPSRVSHSLFGTSTAGIPLRPTVPELVHRGIIRGMGIERRWRDGLYIYSSLVRLKPPHPFPPRTDHTWYGTLSDGHAVRELDAPPMDARAQRRRPYPAHALLARGARGVLPHLRPPAQHDLGSDARIPAACFCRAQAAVGAPT